MSGYTQGQPFTIEVLDGPDKGATIALEGRALPYRGVSFETTQRSKLTWYPGNPVATQQIMGPVESPTIVTGQWKDRFLGDGIARRIGDVIDSLNRTGHSVEVTWGSQFIPDGVGGMNVADVQPYVRRGIIKRFKRTHDRAQEYAYEIEFEWRGRDDKAVTVMTEVFRDSDGYDTVSLQFQSAIDAINSLKNSSTAQLITGLPGQVATIMDNVQTVFDSGVSTLATATRTVQDISDIPDNIRKSVMGATEQGGTACHNAVNASLLFPISVYQVVDHPLDTLETWIMLQQFREQVDAAWAAMHQLQDQLNAEQTPELLVEIRVPEGTDLRLLALKYYGDPDLWTVIADYNHLPGSRVPNNPRGVSDQVGEPIRIPRLGGRNAQRQLSV